MQIISKPLQSCLLRSFHPRQRPCACPSLLAGRRNAGAVQVCDRCTPCDMAKSEDMQPNVRIHSHLEGSQTETPCEHLQLYRD